MGTSERALRAIPQSQPGVLLLAPRGAGKHGHLCKYPQVRGLMVLLSRLKVRIPHSTTLAVRERSLVEFPAVTKTGQSESNQESYS